MKATITDLDMVSIQNEEKVFNEAGIAFERKQLHSEEELIKGCQDSEILMVQYARLTEKVMKALPKLRLIVRYGVGVDSIDLKAASKLGIQVGNVPDYGMNEVADHALTMILALLRKVAVLDQQVKEVKWDYSVCIPVHRFSTLTAGIVGLGRIGRNLAKKLHALGFQVIGYDPYYHPDVETDAYVTVVSFEELLERSDIISLHCPAEGNEKLFNKEIFVKMKNSAILINVARGAVVDDADLDEALKTRQIAAAGLDTVSIEPAPLDYPLFKNNNLIVTPHMAWYSEEAGAELQRKVAEEAVRFAKGEAIHYPVNKPDK